MADLIPINVSSGMIKRAIAENNNRTIFSGIASTPLISGGDAFRERVLEYIGKYTDLLVLEFGVFQGKSMLFWSKNFTNPISRFHGFDSFEGLPENWTPNLQKGAFSTSGVVPDLRDERVTFHTGWIQNTLPGFLRNLPSARSGSMLCHIDVDIYSATLFTLAMIWPYFFRFYLIFDEFEIEENRAMADFCASFPVSVGWRFHTMAKNGLPSKVFCEIEKIPYDPA